MAVAAVVGVTAASAAYTADRNRRAANRQADATRAAAQQQAQAQQDIARQERDQAAALQAQQQQFERDRQAAIDKQQAELRAQQEAAAKQAANDLAIGQQNQVVSDLTPNVQLAQADSGVSSATQARQRRAQFRTNYTSGVTI